MATAQGPLIWMWVDGGGAAPAAPPKRLTLLGVGMVLPLLITFLLGV